MKKFSIDVLSGGKDFLLLFKDSDGGKIIPVSQLEPAERNYHFLPELNPLYGHPLVDENGDVHALSGIVGGLFIIEQEATIEMFAALAFDLDYDRPVDMAFVEKGDSLEDHWSIVKLRYFDTDILLYGSYGGGETYLYDINGEKTEEGFVSDLKYTLEDHLDEFIYLSNPQK